MDVREKLVELVGQVQDCGCDVTDVVKMNYVENEVLADHLIAHGVTVQEWIPVTERLPKPNKLVLCWWQSGDGEREHYGFATFQSHGVWYVSNEGMPDVTHWMPLPQPPKGE